MKTFFAGEWRDGNSVMEVHSPFSGETVDSVPLATPADVELAVGAAEDGAKEMARLPRHRRAEILHQAAVAVESRVAELARLITMEEGKPITEALAEASRVAPLLHLAGEEAIRTYGEVLPMDAADYGVGKTGFTIIEPCGAIAAITPFNYPARLVMFKVAPALAAGNSIVLKPATATPLTALILVECLLAGGVPPLAINCIVGSGATIGAVLCADPRIRKISFTGSREVGARITQVAGIKPLTCELGSNVAVVVLDDADVSDSIKAVARDGYVNAGQVCISAQRIIVTNRVYDEFMSGLTESVDQLVQGDPLNKQTSLGPVISATEAERVVDWAQEAARAGANLVRGGERTGTTVAPLIIVEPPRDSRVWRDEIFGPAVAVHSVVDDEAAIRAANDTSFGLAASVFTRDIDRALNFASQVRTGIVHVNHGPAWRADFMPYGGFGDSGYGKEGIRYSVSEMSETKMVVVHPRGNP